MTKVKHTCADSVVDNSSIWGMAGPKCLMIFTIGLKSHKCLWSEVFGKQIAI